MSLRLERRAADGCSEAGAEVAAFETREFDVTGRVQGVGFRPFVRRLAERHGLAGWVCNRAGAVSILVQGDPAAIAAFDTELVTGAPPLARPSLVASRPSRARLDGAAAATFVILPSVEGDPSQAVVAPDQFACDDCLDEIRDPQARRYRYPFINCTQCGPRYTIIERLPYDRANTAMAGFALCPDCRREYEDPRDRRYHAQPLACPACGPQLAYREPSTEGVTAVGEAALDACVRALRAGRVVAVKGIGGYHLICDAGSGAAVARLRRAKNRPDKPLAVMVGEAGEDRLAEARRLVDLDEGAAAMLADPMRPIVLARKRADAPLAAGVAPGLGAVGVMLPYSPLHHLLLEAFAAPLVATSGNVSGEPVLTDPAEAEARLGAIADAFLHHDRPIRRPADDPVYCVIAGKARPVRLGRGSAPLSLRLPVRLDRPCLAVGGQMKVTVALGWENRVVVSPHIGELSSPRGMAVFRQVIADLQALYGVAAECVVADAHPGYGSSRWARACGLPVVPVLHHHAHASALAGEHGAGEYGAGEYGARERAIREPMLVFAWDGVGLGGDGTLWGGEAFHGRPGYWRRVASFRPFRPPGADKAGREPWRSALALCWEAGVEWPGAARFADERLLHAWARRLNAPETSAVGRLFDAAAALTGLVDVASFEGQGPMWLEAASHDGARPVALPLAHGADAVWRSDWAPLLPVLLDERLSAGERGAVFHASLAAAILAQARAIRSETGATVVGLTGGVFQNRLLAEAAERLLVADGFRVLMAESVPANDAGLSFGQMVEAACRMPS